MGTPGVYRDLDALMQPYTSQHTCLRVPSVSGASSGTCSPNPLSPLRSPPRVPELHIHPPGDYLAPLPPEQSHGAVPSLAANVPYYHVPGPCAENRRNLRLAAPVRTHHYLHHTVDGSSPGPARLVKRAPHLLCLPCGSPSWTLRLQRSDTDVRARCVSVLLLAVALLLVTTAVLTLLAAYLYPDAMSEWRKVAVEEVPVNLSTAENNNVVVTGEFVLTNENFHSELDDTRSPSFNALSSQLTSQLDDLFRINKDLGEEYNGSEITALQSRSDLLPGVVVQCRLDISARADEDEGEPANRVGLAFLTGLHNHEGGMWLGKFEVDIQSISFSSAARLPPLTVVETVNEHLEPGWTEWGPWGPCDAEETRSRTRQCALQGGTGEILINVKRCLVHGGGDLQLRDCRDANESAESRELPELLAVREMSPHNNAIRIVPTKSLRLCDECTADEICVALLGDPVPLCRLPKDRTDPTGCGGLCQINMELCHKLDTDAFRCLDDSRCLENEWRCGNKLCVPKVKRCDGHLNCYDYTDEYNCPCNMLTHFHCGNRTSCLPLSKRCDGVVDCWDASDEKNCTAACPSPAHFTCSNGDCIPHSKFCDGFNDCKDKSDEPFGCGGDCKPSEFRCRNGRCVRRFTVCDGFDSCGDGSDEEGCTDPKMPDKLTLAPIAETERSLLLGCAENQFQCAGGDCILRSLVCDGVDDCGDKSDEHSCP